MMGANLPRMAQADSSGHGNVHTKLTRAAAIWALMVFLFAGQWYAYDALRSQSEPFAYYFGWSCYLWIVLTPLALWLARRHPILPETWKQALSLHVAASLVFSAITISIEAWLASTRASGALPMGRALRHYFGWHSEVSLLCYWLLICAAQYYYMYQRDRTRELQAIELKAQVGAAQLDLLRMQLHPHFLFNTLQAASQLIYQDPEAAEQVLLQLSELLRISLEEIHVHEVPLWREIQVLRHYLDIQQRRFGDRLTFETCVDGQVANCAVPTFILQPLVENAIRHGIAKRKGCDTITVRASLERQQLRLEVLNRNGNLDRDPDLSWGTGLANTRARLQQLYGKQHALRIEEADSGGVLVTLSIPNRQIEYEPEHEVLAVAGLE